MIFRYKHGLTVFNTALICWIVSACVCVGNTLLQANCWAGGLDAVLAIPGADELVGGAEVGLRVGTCVAYAVVVLVLLWFDATERLGIFLGIVMLGMVSLFLVVVIKMGIDFERYVLSRQSTQGTQIYSSGFSANRIFPPHTSQVKSMVARATLVQGVTLTTH